MRRGKPLGRHSPRKLGERREVAAENAILDRLDAADVRPRQHGRVVLGRGVGHVDAIINSVLGLLGERIQINKHPGISVCTQNIKEMRLGRRATRAEWTNHWLLKFEHAAGTRNKLEQQLNLIRFQQLSPGKLKKQNGTRRAVIGRESNRIPTRMCCRPSDSTLLSRLRGLCCRTGCSGGN